MKKKDQEPRHISHDNNREREIVKVFEILNKSELSTPISTPNDYYGTDRPFKEFTMLKYKGLDFKLTSSS